MFIYIVPLVLIALALLCFLREEPLKTTIDREIRPNSPEIDGASRVHLDGDDTSGKSEHFL